MRRIIFIVLSILVTLSINAQSEATHVEEKVYDVVEEMPQFPGGPSALFEYLSNNLQYPVVAEENGVQGRVIVNCNFYRRERRIYFKCESGKICRFVL